MRVLQEFGKDNFPLDKYIVDVKKDISPPSYLTNDTVYRISNGFPDGDPQAKMSTVQILSNLEWPPSDDFNLDESQFEAFRAALTKQMVIIQGPPGNASDSFFIELRLNLIQPLNQVLEKHTSDCE